MNMKKNLKQGLILAGLMLGALMLVNVPAVAFASGLIDDVNPISALGEIAPGNDIKELALTIVNYFLTFLGIVAVMMIIFGGVTYVTAAGKQESIDNAKKIITYALVGLLIIMVSFALVYTVLQAGGGGSSTVVQ
jgi:cytochrome bd-type quinol oxidase subunit 2